MVKRIAAAALPAVLLLSPLLHASPEGKIYGQHAGKNAVYDVVRHTLRPVAQLPAVQNPGASQNGRWVVDSTETQVRLINVRTGAYRILFDSKHPDALYNVLKTSKFKNLRALYQDAADTEPKFKLWVLSDPQITRDGRSVYFMTNAGGEDAENYEFCCVHVDVATGKLSVLSQVFWGQGANIFALSPNSKELLIGLPDHNTAADNSYNIDVIDLVDDKSVDVLKPDPKDKTCINDVTGACWSPDSRHLAISVAYYAESQISDDFKPVYNLEIKSATTGHCIETVPDFTSPAWR
jgi:hypothetical protein